MELETQLGLYFKPDNLGPNNYPRTHKFWTAHKNLYQYKDKKGTKQDKSIQLVIEAGYHTIQEFEHNTPETEMGRQDLLMAILTVYEMIRLIVEGS